METHHPFSMTTRNPKTQVKLKNESSVTSRGRAPTRLTSRPWTDEQLTPDLKVPQRRGPGLRGPRQALLNPFLPTCVVGGGWQGCRMHHVEVVAPQSGPLEGHFAGRGFLPPEAEPRTGEAGTARAEWTHKS